MQILLMIHAWFRTTNPLNSVETTCDAISKMSKMKVKGYRFGRLGEKVRFDCADGTRSYQDGGR